MRLLRRSSPLDDLVPRAAAGDDDALAVLRADLSARTLADLRRLVPAADGSPVAVVAAARAVARDGAAGLGAVVDLLLEADVRTAAVVGELLGLPEEAVLALAGRRPACRAWSLLTGARGLTEQEREAGRAHAAGCRPCSAVLDGERVPTGRARTGVPAR